MLPLVLVVLCISTTANGAMPFRSKKYKPAEFSPAVDCVNPAFNWPVYFQEIEKATPIKVMYNRGMSAIYSQSFMDRFHHTKARKAFGIGHVFLEIAAHNCLQADLTDKSDPLGCLPFSNTIHRIKTVHQCFIAHPQYELGQGRYPETLRHQGNYNYYDVDEYQQWYYTFGALAEDTGDWLSNSALRRVYSSAQLERHAHQPLLDCVEQTQLVQNDFKCWPVLLGQPGLNDQTLFDHSDNVVHPNRREYHHCDIPPACGRLAVSKLHHFQDIKFNSYLLKGAYKAKNIAKKKHWSLQNERFVHDKCNVRPEKYNNVVCWNFSRCFRQMVKVVCNEHSACCPSEQAHNACQDPSHPECQICRPSYQKLHL